MFWSVRGVGVALTAAVALLFVGGASGVGGGETLSIRAAPWSVVVRQDGAMVCTGVIVDATHVLTAGHCVVGGSMAKPDARVTVFNEDDFVSHDLAEFTLSRPLVLTTPYARAARLPNATAAEPSASTRLVLAGYGQENINQPPNGSLNGVYTRLVHRDCTTLGALCVWSTSTSTCYGDSGAGLVEPGSPPTVVGLVSEGNGESTCAPANMTTLAASSNYPEGYTFLGSAVYLGSSAVLTFIRR
jgi:hypothetical protein